MENQESIDFTNIPFEDTDNYNFYEGFYKTILMVLFSPKAFFDKMHVNKGLKKPFLFAFTITVISIFFINIYMSYGIIDTPREQIQSLSETSGNLEILEMLDKIPEYEFTLAIIFEQIFSYILMLLTVAFIWHSSLSIVGATRNGFEATFRVIAYSSAIGILGILPLNLGFANIFIYIWWFIIVLKGIQEAHEVPNSKAIGGVLLSVIFTSIVFLMFMGM